MVDRYEKRYERAGGTMASIRDMPLSKFGKVQGDVFYIRGPEVIKDSGVRAMDIAAAAALTAGVIWYKIGKHGKKKKIPKKYLGTETPKDTGPTGLRAKPDPVKRAADRTQDYQKKTYAKGGGVRKAARYS